MKLYWHPAMQVMYKVVLVLEYNQKNIFYNFKSATDGGLKNLIFDKKIDRLPKSPPMS
jgi:hypothetical protein